MDNELEEIRKKRLAQLQEQQNALQSDPNNAYRQEQAKAEMEMKKQEILRKILTPEARERLTTLKMSRQGLVEQLEYQLISMAQAGHIQSVIDDNQLKQLLLKIQPKKRTTTIKRL